MHGLTKLVKLSFYTSGNISNLAVIIDISKCVSLGKLNLWYSKVVGVGSIDNLHALHTFRFYNSEASTETLDALLESMYYNRLLYPTDVTLSANISGNAGSPSGYYQDSSPPTTGREFIYKLVNNPDEEGFNKWTITY